jgi:outer membrane biosynthesis protein TonB
LALKDSTNQGYILSILLHAGIIALAVTGMPFLKRELPTENPPLIVDLVPIEEQTTAAPPPNPEPAPAAPVIPEPPAPAQAEAPTADAMPPPPKEETPVEQKIEQPKIKPIPKPKPPTPSKNQDIAMLQNLLKDLEKKSPAPQPQAQSKAETPTNNIAPNITDRASMTELDAIRHHIESCWRIDPGKEGEDKMAVDIKVNVNPDGTMRAQVVDMARYFADPTFRSFATSARNAVIGCGKLPIPPEHYGLYKEIIMTFSPQGRIN